ncbi:MAG: phage tail tape measure protein, partial [Alistipes sp.]|nr:phage tail tape measure protein [Alistipes sp.]
MADNNTTTVRLQVNGKDAEQELQRLEKEVESLRTAFIKAGEAGDRAMAEKFRKEIKKTEAEIRKMESGTKACQRVFAQLDKASPADLQRALKFLNSELKNIERGSAAWTAQTEKIRRVKAELDKVNAELRQSEGMFARMKNTVNDWGASIAAGAAAMAGLVAAGKAAVEAYAEMDQEMANVRKYTGMTAEQVDHLNEEFKKMDTRTSREALNQLAQEAGRLGKQSEEDVLGFVRAADKINVALDDLGEGATLTLSKLTNIFGDEERLGTERSLLAVGSVINELSQNSTASAPYLAEFAQRLAGVGAQANMTIPEIMGFAAVLDSQGQKLEMSSTAVSKVI